MTFDADLLNETVGGFDWTAIMPGMCLELADLLDDVEEPRSFESHYTPVRELEHVPVRELEHVPVRELEHVPVRDEDGYEPQEYREADFW